MKICRHCGTPDLTVAKRTGDYTLLCMECHLDFTSVPVTQGDEPVETRVAFPKEKPYTPSRFAVVSGGGR